MRWCASVAAETGHRPTGLAAAENVRANVGKLICLFRNKDVILSVESSVMCRIRNHAAPAGPGETLRHHKEL